MSALWSLKEIGRPDIWLGRPDKPLQPALLRQVPGPCLLFESKEAAEAFWQHNLEYMLSQVWQSRHPGIWHSKKFIVAVEVTVTCHACNRQAVQWCPFCHRASCSSGHLKWATHKCDVWIPCNGVWPNAKEY